MVKIETRYMTKNPCYGVKRTINVKGLVLHSVGCAQPNKEVFFNNWNKSTYNNASVHGFIDNDGCIICLPCMENTQTSKPGVAHRGWHIGSGTKGSGNNTHLGFEMTEPSCIKYTGGATFTCSDKAKAISFVKKNIENAIELFARLCIYHSLDPLADGVIISHSEGYSRGIGSNHGDPVHLFNQLGMTYSMDQFREDVNARVQELKSEKQTPTSIVNYDSNKEEDDMTDERFMELMNNYRNTLRDNDCNEYSKDAREWAIQNGIIAGSGQKLANGEVNYMWADTMSREQFVTVLYRFAKLIGKA